MAWSKRTGIMLAQPLDEKNLAKNKILFNGDLIFAQPKLDGMRCWVHWAGDEPLLFSSEGNRILGVPHIEKYLKAGYSHMTKKPCFDGELYSKAFSFEQIIAIAKRRPLTLHDSYEDLDYNIFDIKDCEKVFVERLTDLKRLVSPGIDTSNPLKRVDTRLISYKDIDKTLDDYINDGYEGIILRNVLLPYVERRVPYMLKWKPSKYDYYKVVAILEAVSEQGIPKGKAGAILLSDRNGHEFKAGCGLGIDDEVAARVWENRDSLVGWYAEVQYQNLTKNGVPRFAKFTKITPTNPEDSLQ